MTHKPQKNIRLILNPAAGQRQPSLKLMNRIFHSADYEWDVKITNKFGDGRKLAQKALREGVDIVAVYGGDGTVMDVASGMVGSEVPLAVIPGGTGNAIAIELGIPFDIASNSSMIVDPAHGIRKIDIGKTGRHPFLLRVGVGLEAVITHTASREMKDQYGIFAYIMTGLQAASEMVPSRYRLILDGKEVESEGLACMIANAGTAGVPGLSLSPVIKINDGLLDVFIIRSADVTTLYNLAASVLGSPIDATTIPHWQAKDIQVWADPVQPVEADGEPITHTPVRMKIIPQALNVIVP